MAVSRGLREAFRVNRAVAGGVILSYEDDTTAAHYAEQVPRGYLVGEYGKRVSCCHLYRYESGFHILAFSKNSKASKINNLDESYRAKR